MDDDEPWALYLVTRVERDALPSAGDALIAAGAAVATLLADDRCAVGGEWHGAVARWRAGRIRKIVRRARGAAWHRGEAVAGITVSVGTAHVRALVPMAVGEMPADIAKMQVGGLDLVGANERASADATDLPDAAAAVPFVHVAINPALEVSTGKLMAQVGHATNLALWTMTAIEREHWAGRGFMIGLLHPTAQQWGRGLRTAPVVVSDGGFTEVEPGTKTTLAFW